MHVTFYGVRGSIATPGPSTVRYGGNTVCVEVRLQDGTPIVLDAGTGIRELGRVLVANPPPGPIHQLLTHAHWDHIIGLPFFAPLWRKETQLRLYPLATAAQERLRHASVLFDEIHFPVRAADIPARIELVDAEVASFRIGSATVRRIALNHPGGSQGFRIDDDGGASFAYITDNELSPPGDVTTSLAALAEFCRGVDLLVHDAQYVEADMPMKHGWGHSLVKDVLALGVAAEARTLALFHHEPDRDDEALDLIGLQASAWLSEQKSATRVLVAREGLALHVTRG